MQKIASNGATVTNEFTEGNANLAIPATVVSADWLNSVQREMVNTLLLLAGKTPLTNATSGPSADTFDQVAESIKEFFLRGGRVAPIATTIVNNQASAADVTGFPTFSRTVIHGFSFDYFIRRRTDSENVSVLGKAKAVYNQDTTSWKIIQDEMEPTGVDLSIAVDSGDIFKLQYKSDNIAGASYASAFKITNLVQIII